MEIVNSNRKLLRGDLEIFMLDRCLILPFTKLDPHALLRSPMEVCFSVALSQVHTSETFVFGARDAVTLEQ